MVRRGIILALVGSVAVVIAACGDEHDYAVGHASGGRTATSCESVSTCGECTPIVGCGWCALPNGTGACVSGPDQCQAQVFSWTWEPTGCREPVDASGITITPAPREDAGSQDDTDPPNDAGSDARDAAPDAENIH